MNQINPLRGGDEGVFSWTFKMIGQWSSKQLGCNLSKRLWEINHLSTVGWRKRIWNIHYKNLPKNE
jgi:hypothetical protein